MLEASLRHEISELGTALEAAELLSMTAGNISARAGSNVVITPSGIAYSKTRAEDVVVCDLHDGHVVEGDCRPSSELPLHRAIYTARPDVGAVVHTHSMFATTFALLREPIPAVHYMIARLGTPLVPVVDYATYGSDSLAELVFQALSEGVWAALLANHGAIAMGRNLAEAGKNAEILERLAEMYWRARSIGEPFVLPNEEIGRVAEQYKTYGQP